jgi:hypothetical protein
LVKLKGSSEDIITGFEHCLLAVEDMLSRCILIEARLRQVVLP